jgi:hypothetical protein
MSTTIISVRPIERGDRVYHIDPRHVGVVVAMFQSGIAKIEWEERKWISYLRISELNPAVETPE